MKKDSRVKAVISLDAVEHNFREMRKNIAEETKMIAVIKADAYGHGAVPIAHLIEDYDYIWGFAAATAEEAIHLREAGITKPILILGIVFDEYFPDLSVMRSVLQCANIRRQGNFQTKRFCRKKLYIFILLWTQE